MKTITIQISEWIHNIKNVICDINNKLWWENTKVNCFYAIEVRLYRLEINCKNYKMFYVSPMETTKKYQKERERNQSKSLQKKSTQHKIRQQERK